MPAVLPRLVRVPGADSTYVRLETVVMSQLSTLFPGQTVRDVAAFRVLRDAELDIDDEGGGDDFLSQVEDEVRAYIELFHADSQLIEVFHRDPFVTESSRYRAYRDRIEPLSHRGDGGRVAYVIMFLVFVVAALAGFFTTRWVGGARR